MKIVIEDVGREQRGWTLCVPDNADVLLIGHAIEASVRRKGGLISRNVWVSMEGDTRSGYINAGFHNVGRWHIEEAPCT